MDSKSPGLTEAFAALLTLERFLFRMNVPAEETQENWTKRSGIIKVLEIVAFGDQ